MLASNFQRHFSVGTIGEDEPEEPEPLEEPGQATLADIYRLMRYNTQKINNNSKRIQKLVKTNTNKGLDMAAVQQKFRQYDIDNEGSIDAAEFEAVLQDLNIEVGPKQYKQLWDAITGGDGEIEIDEFADLIKDELENAREKGWSLEQVLRKIIYQKLEELEGMCQTESQDIVVWNTYPHAPYEKWPSPEKSIRRGCMRLHFTMEDENYSWISMSIFIYIMACIFVSTLTFVFETLPQWKSWEGFVILEWIISLSFSVELFIRCLVCRNPLMFWKRTWYFWTVMNLIDVLAVVPFYIEIMFPGGNTDFLRVIRVIRLLRLMRLRRFQSLTYSMEIIGEAIGRSIDESGVLLTVLIVFELLVFSAIVFVCEKGVPVPTSFCEGIDNQLQCLQHSVDGDMLLDSDGRIVGPGEEAGERPGETVWTCQTIGGDVTATFANQEACEGAGHSWSPVQQTGVVLIVAGANLCTWHGAPDNCQSSYFRTDGAPSPFTSIPATMWWTFTTMTTVGYGDYSPHEPMGKFMGMAAMLTGILAIAIFVVIVATNFDKAQKNYEKMRYFRRMANLRAEHNKAAVRGQTLRGQVSPYGGYRKTSDSGAELESVSTDEINVDKMPALPDEEMPAAEGRADKGSKGPAPVTP